MLQQAVVTERNPMITVDVAEAEKTMRALLERVEAGEEVVITRDGEPVARVEAVQLGAKAPLPLAELEALRGSLPPWTKDSATLISEMRDEEW